MVKALIRAGNVSGKNCRSGYVGGKKSGPGSGRLNPRVERVVGVKLLKGQVA